MRSTLACMLLLLSALLFSGHTQDLPTATVNIVSPPAPYYPGDQVTLQCDIPEYEDWSYDWNINYQPGPRLENKTCSFNLDYGNTFRYICVGTRTGPMYSEWSADLIITVTDLPTATVNIISPSAPLYPGDQVTLQCDIPEYEDWSYTWFRDNQQVPSETSNLYSFRLTDVSTQYSCQGQRGGRPQKSLHSAGRFIIVKALPKATLTVTPNPVYHGETVTLRCSVESDQEWSYRWYQGDRREEVPLSGRSSISGDTLTISQVVHSDQRFNRCRGEIQSRSITSMDSDQDYLHVNARPQPILRVSPWWLNPGDSVTLSCEVGDSSPGWSFSFYRAVPSLPDQSYSVEVLSGSDQTTGNSSTLHSAGLSHTAGYMCRAARGETVYYTDYSQPQFHWSGDQHSSVSLSVSSNRSQHWISESVTLSSEMKEISTGWRLKRFTDREKTVCSSVRGSTTGSTCTISLLHSGNSGVYWCESGSGESSNAVNITVHHGFVILESPVHPVTEGDSVKILCKHRSPPSNPKVDFYKDGQLIRNETTGEMTIPAVSQSDEGLYKCKYSDGEESPESWLLVRGWVVPGQGVSLLPRLVCGVVVTSPFLVVTVLLVLICLQKPAKPAKEDKRAEPSRQTGRDCQYEDTGL